MKHNHHSHSRYLWAIFLGLFALGFTIQADAAKPKTPEQQLKYDKRYKGFAEKQLNNIRRAIKSNTMPSADRGIKQAEKYISKISTEFMTGAEGSALRKELDDLKKQVADMKAGNAVASENANAILQEKVNYGSSVRQYAKTYYLLVAGKNKSAGDYSYDFSEIEELNDNLPAFVAYETEFRKSFPNLIQGMPNYSYESIQVDVLLDVFQHAKEYQANFTEVVGNRLLDIQFEQLKKVVDRINEYQYVSVRDLGDLYGSKTSNEYFDIDTKLKPYYAAVSRPLPNDRLKELATYKPKIRKLLESAAEKLSWDEKKYPVQNGDIEKVAEHLADKHDWKLIEYGTTDTAYLKKNALGVPLHKYYEGMIVVRVGNEPFNRAYRATFYDYFDGTGYPGISDVKIETEVRPYKQ